MANPSYYQTSHAVTSMVQHQEHVFHVIAHPRNNNQRNIVPSLPDTVGVTWVLNWELTDGAMVIGQLQGVAMCANSSLNWYLSSNLVFTDERFHGSTLSVQGCLGPALEGDLAVIGGTGEFTCAQGNVRYKTTEVLNVSEAAGQGTKELHIHVICLTFPKPKPVQKVGPWGGNGGTPFEIQEADHVPQRLDSLTIFDDDVIESIEFSYTDQAGQTRTVGAWGGGDDDGKSMNPPIQFAASETVMEIYGATGNYKGRTVVTSLTIVTNVMAYGPYGKQSQGNTPFHVAAPKDQSIVGFYGRTDGSAVNQIGVYVISPN